MRIKMFMLAIVAAMATTLPAQAGAVLGFGLGAQQPPGGMVPDPATPSSPPGSNIDPATTFGLGDFTFGTSLGSTNGATQGTIGNPFVMTQGQQYILQIQMVDTNVKTFPNTASGRMFQWSARMNIDTLGVLQVGRDPNALDNLSFESTVNDSSGLPQSNINASNNDFTGIGPDYSSVSFGNIFFSNWVSSSANPYNYALANFVVTASGTGTVKLSLTDRRPGQGTPTTTDWSNAGGTALDSAVFAVIPELFIQVNPVPEPSSMALAGLAVSGLVYRLRRRKTAVVA